MTQNDAPDPKRRAMELFAEFQGKATELREADLEAWISEHADLESELREIIDEVRSLRELLDLPTRSIVRELQIRGAADVSPSVELPTEADLSEEGEESMLSRLNRHETDRRYAVEKEIGRGGGGTIVRVRDLDLRRSLAMKVVGGRSLRPGSNMPSNAVLSRFLEEAQVTGQLDHPGVVPLHELGLDARGRAYFTMRLVRGRDLQKTLALVPEGKEGWSRERVLGVLLKVCETMAFAHTKGVLHRDLKPSNVMVGRFGEVYVMDWGLAKAAGQREGRDLRVRETDSSMLSSIRTDRRDESEAGPESSLVTMDGTVLGTPAYMPPEQAQGRIEELGPQSDVYSVGAMLYHTLTGQAPYAQPNARLDAYAFLALVISGPPTPIRKLTKDVPVELEAICDKAMAREPRDRYENMVAMADDLRAYLEGRVVRAYRTGAGIELRKWISRNKRFVSIVSSVLVLALIASSVALRQTVMAQEREVITAHYRDLQVLRGLGDQVDSLWPAHPQHIPAYERWLERALDVITRRDSYRLEREEFEQNSISASELQLEQDRLTHPQFAELEHLRNNLDWRQRRLSYFLEHDRDPEMPVGQYLSEERAEGRIQYRRNKIKAIEGEISALEEAVEVPYSVHFETPSDRFWFEVLDEIVLGLDALVEAEGGRVQQIQDRLEQARRIEPDTVSGAVASAAWADAITAIELAPAYRGLRIKPQIGLLPIGTDTLSALWEFACLETGDTVTRDASGNLQIASESAVVLVLIPGGDFVMGAQNIEPSKPHYDAEAHSNELFPHHVQLAPYFISKFELTQMQWQRLMGNRPSEYAYGSSKGGQVIQPTNPVESVSWEDTAIALRRAGLQFPTEAQWEYAARAGTQGSRWCGNGPTSLLHKENGPDQSARDWLAGRLDYGWDAVGTWLEESDAWLVPAPVGTFPPNPFGLHDTLGNVSEWCLDPYQNYQRLVKEGTGERRSEADGYRALRGGSYSEDLVQLRVTSRQGHDPALSEHMIGVRPARLLED
ncbi:MAG: formylglycine-generating enzyme required for sulfatase activity/serine/threonine protein kinase [Planctomycetota bacterium]|jgi:formylglycine-generating enzyme required for sulfatase activity/serine/threonine protein kinase